MLLSPAAEAGFTAAFVLIGALGVLGNIAVLVVVVMQRTLRRSLMHQILANLAMADLINLVTNVPDIIDILVSQIHWTPVGCKVLRFSSIASLYASVLFQMAVCIERFVAIIFPHHFQSFQHSVGILTITSVVWGLASAFASPYAYFSEFRYYPGRNGSEGAWHCRWIRKEGTCTNCFKYTEFAVFYLIPIVFMSAVYGRICLRLWHRQTALLMKNKQKASTRHRLDSKRNVIVMLLVSMAVYSISYSPMQVLLISHMLNLRLQITMQIHLLFNVMMWASSAANPIVYTICFPQFRHALRSTLCLRSAEMKVLQKRMQIDTMAKNRVDQEPSNDDSLITMSTTEQRTKACKEEQSHRAKKWSRIEKRLRITCGTFSLFLSPQTTRSCVTEQSDSEDAAEIFL